MMHNDSNQTWSHKGGNGEITNISKTSHVVINKNNFTTKLCEGGYDDGIRYYLIKKSAVMDYPHQYGHSPSCSATAFSVWDKAGDSITKSVSLGSSGSQGRFDYPKDLDFYSFIPDTNGTYYFSVTSASGSNDIDLKIFNKYGIMISQNLSAGNPSLSLSLQAGQRYFIEVFDSANSTSMYTITYHH